MLLNLLISRSSQLQAYVESKIPRNLRRSVAPEDVLQEVWSAAFQNAGAFIWQDEEAFDRWLITITHRKLIDTLRRNRTGKRGGENNRLNDFCRDTASYVDLFDRLAAQRDTPSSELSSRERVAAVRSAISALPPDQREAIHLRHIEGKSYEQVARALGKSKQAIRGLLTRGMDSLRSSIGSALQYYSDERSIDEPPGANGSGNHA